MGVTTLLLPRQLPPLARANLERACLAGAYDSTPVPTTVELGDEILTLSRELDESGFLLVPWTVPELGRLIASSSTLKERAKPYPLLVELARGKLNQLRNQTLEWRTIGLQVPPVAEEIMRSAIKKFADALTLLPDPTAQDVAGLALIEGFRAADELGVSYAEQLLASRLQREGPLPTAFGVRLGTLPPPATAELLKSACNTVVVPLTWRHVEPVESQYRWERADELIEWATRQGVAVAAGPLIDFGSGLPDWLTLWDNDPQSLASFMCDYVGTVVTRYRDRVRRWQITAASNLAPVLGLAEDELLRLTARLCEAAWTIDPDLELVVGIAQPWGEYMTDEEHTCSPVVFADNLLRGGLRLAALDIELYPGFYGRGSYCRDLIETSRLLDYYSLMGTPLQVSCGYPSSEAADPHAAPGLTVGAGHWGAGYINRAQANWAASFGALALCKPFVSAVNWAHFADGETHLLPNAGLLDAAGTPRPALTRWRLLRQTYLR